MGGAWATSGAAIDTFVTVNGEGNHKDCPYTDALGSREDPRADLDRSCRGSSCGCPFRVRWRRRHRDAGECETGSKARSLAVAASALLTLRVEATRIDQLLSHLRIEIRLGGLQCGEGSECGDDQLEQVEWIIGGLAVCERCK